MCSVTALYPKHPGFDSRHPHNHQDWWLSPLTLLLGTRIWDEAGNPGLYNLVEQSGVRFVRSHCSSFKKTVALHNAHGSGWYKALNWKAPNAKKHPFQFSLGRYVGSQSDCILLAINGEDIQAINGWVSKCAHKFTYRTKSGRRKRENGWRLTN